MNINNPKNKSSKIKRIFDLTASLLGLLVISPLFLVIIIILKFTGEGEIFYLQKRIGLNNRPFYIYKFATMLKDSPNMGNKTLTVRKDPRITSVGTILRLTKINELPQILNVIIGNMALIGPRPLLEIGYNKYSQKTKDVICKNKPGISGIGSLIFRDEEELVTAFKALGKNPSDYYKSYIYPYKGELEEWYYYNRSISVDFKILFLTFYSLVNRNSQLVYKIFKNLPSKPHALTKNGVRQL